MSRRQDGATATVGAGLTAGGGYLRHTGVKELIRHQGGKQPKVHGWAIARHGTPLSRKLYGAGAVVGLVGAPALAIGGTRFVRKQPVEKMGEKFAAHYTTRMLQAGGKLAPKGYKKAGPARRLARGALYRTATDASPFVKPLESLAKRDHPSFLQEGIKGTGSALLERKDTLTTKAPGKARAAGYATTTGAGALGVLGVRLAMRGKSGGAKAIASPVAGVLAGAAATPLSSHVVHRVSPGYEVTASGVKRVKKAPKRPSSASYRHHDIPRSFASDIQKLDSAKAKYRGGIMAAGTVPIAGYGLQAAAARRGIKSTSDRNKASATQFGAASGGDAVGFLAGSHGAALAAKHSDRFASGATKTSEWMDRKKDAARGKVGLGPKAPKQLKPPGAGSGKAGRAYRAAVKPLRGKYGVAAGVGGVAGMMVSGNAASQVNISRNYRRYVSKGAPAPGMTRAEQNKQMKRKARLIAINTLGATTGAAGLGTFTASRMHRFAAHKPQLEAATLGLGAVGGGIGSYGGFKRAKVERRDLRAQRKALGVAKYANAEDEEWDRAHLAQERSRQDQKRKNAKLGRHPELGWWSHSMHQDDPKHDAFHGPHKSKKHAQAALEGFWDGLDGSTDEEDQHDGGRVYHGLPPWARKKRKKKVVSKGMPDPSAMHVPTGLLKTKSYTASALRTTQTGRLVRVKAGMR